MQPFQRLLTVMVVPAAAACVEYDLSTEYPSFPDSNPPVPEEITQTDTIVQVTTPEVDILWTIDNSCSMYDEQTALTENFPSFMGYFSGSGLDFHVGVVSTDTDDPSHSGKLRQAAGVKFIEPDTPNPTQVFTAMAAMGTSGSGTERGLGGTFLALETLRDTFNSGYYRDEAAIHTILISDEPDYTQASLITKDEFVDWYDGLKREADERTFSTIASPQIGGTYFSITAQIGGIQWDINDTSWAAVLDRLGVQASGLKREYFLSQQPVDSSIVVEVHDGPNVFKFERAVLDEYGVPLEGDWLYDQTRNSITFIEYVPEALAKVVINYTLLAAVQGEGGQVSEEM